MSFVSVSFLAFYLVVLCFRFTLGRDSRNSQYLISLLVLSLVFYGWHVPEYLFVILAIILVNYAAGRLITRFDPSKRLPRLVVLSLVICTCLGLLAYFKYASFLLGIVSGFVGYEITTDSRFSALDIVLPIGISFYTFQSLSYTIDVYRGRMKSEPSLSRFSLFIGFFPQLVAGPIVRANQFFYQLRRKRSVRLTVFLQGCYLILRGLFLKVVIADNLGQVVDKYWVLGAQPDAPAALTFSLVVFFSCQLFCDFLGYTDIARGIAYQLGFRLPINFKAPYIARTFGEFWRRWHITLSEWMRDYVYVPLGGNRTGSLNTSRNLMLVMLVSGLWHGAGLNFLLWGAMHGVAIVFERALGLSTWLKANNRGALVLLAGLAWFLVVQLTWIMSMALFRAADGAEGWQVLQNAFAGLITLPQHGLDYPESNGLITAAWWFTLPVWWIHLRTYLSERFELSQTIYEKTIYAGIMIYSVLTLYSTNPAFIYFQF